MTTNIGIVSDEITRDFADALRIGTGLGIRRYEIRNLPAGRAPMCGDAAMREVEMLARDAGVEITALSPGLFKMTAEEAEFRREMSEVYPRSVEWAKRWKLPGLITFGFHKNAPAQWVEWLAEAGERAAADGLILMVEPEPICWCDTGQATVNAIAGKRGLKINYDPGNVAWLTGRDPLDEFDAVAPYIANVHVKDLKGIVNGEPEWVPPGEGIIDYVAHFRKLRDYEGPISLEPHGAEVGACKRAIERIMDRR